MSFLREVWWYLVGTLGKIVLWMWGKTARIKILGEEEYKKLREQGKPMILLVWHGRIFIAPYFFRRTGVVPLISPSKDGEIAAQIAARWGYEVLRGSGSHAMIKAWKSMKSRLQGGKALFVVPDGPRGPDRKVKPGSLKLAHEAGAYLVPFTFSASRKKFLKSWDSFLLFYPFSRVIVIYGKPVEIRSCLRAKEIEEERRKIENYMISLDRKADSYYK